MIKLISRRWLTCLYAIVTVLMAVYGWSINSVNRTKAFAESNCPAATQSWQTSAANLKSFGFSDASSYFYAIDSKGTATVYSLAGEKRSALDIDKASKLIIAPGGRYAMAYSPLNPVDSTLTFFGPRGEKLWSLEVDGAVWSAGACTSQENARFVVGTGDRYVYVIDVSEKNRRYRRWRAPGVVVSLVVDRKGKHVTLGCWQDSSITRCTLTGRRLWSRDANPSELQYVERTAASDRILVRSTPNKSGVDGTFSLLDGTGKRVWGGKIKTSEKTQLVCSPNGKYVCLGYEKSISHKGETTSEKHAALFDSRGRRLWDKGSLLFHPQPLLVTSEGCVVLLSDSNAVFTMSRDGELDPSIKLPSSVAKSAASPNGSSALLQCADGKLRMLKISG